MAVPPRSSGSSTPTGASVENSSSFGDETDEQADLFEAIRLLTVVPEQLTGAVKYFRRVIAAKVERTMHDPPPAIRSGKSQHPAPAARCPLGDDAAAPRQEVGIPLHLPADFLPPGLRIAPSGCNHGQPAYACSFAWPIGAEATR